VVSDARFWVALSCLALCASASAEVVIWVNNAPVPVGCPAPPPAVVMNRSKDGTPVYTREAITGNTLQLCYLYPVSRRELWTDYPEKGGEFIKVLPRNATK